MSSLARKITTAVSLSEVEEAAVGAGGGGGGGGRRIRSWSAVVVGAAYSTPGGRSGVPYAAPASSSDPSAHILRRCTRPIACLRRHEEFNPANGLWRAAEGGAASHTVAQFGADASCIVTGPHSMLPNDGRTRAL